MTKSEIKKQLNSYTKKQLDRLCQTDNIMRKKIKNFLKGANKKMSNIKYAKVLLGRNKIYPIYKINYETKQVTLKESEKAFLTVLWKDAEMIYDI